MRIQAITRMNGYGLSKDVQVLRESLEPLGHTIEVTEWDKPRRSGRWDWNIFLELIDARHFASARVNAFVPNPDWFDNRWTADLGRMDIVLAKTKDALRIFSELHTNTVHTGWTSPDTDERVDHTIPGAVHMAGHSIMKGTDAVMKAAALVPGMPITVAAVHWKGVAPSNVTFLKRKVSDEERSRLLRFPIHVQPSTYEGFGHVLNEARAMGATIITTNAEPMSELVRPEFGFLAPVRTVGKHNLSPQFHADPEGIATCIELAWENIREHGAAWGKRARAAYERDRREFTERIQSIVR